MKFTAVEIEAGNVKLLELAAYVARRQAAKPAAGYDQMRLMHTCGAPACMVGHGAALHGVLRGPPHIFALAPSHTLYAMDDDEWFELFSTRGCDDARDNWRKAVRYVRAFVAMRRAAVTA